MTTRIPAERARPNLALFHRQAQVCTYVVAAITLIVLLAEPGHGLLKAAFRLATQMISTILN